MVARHAYRKNKAKVQKARARQRKKNHNVRKRIARQRHQEKFENGCRQVRQRKLRLARSYLNRFGWSDCRRALVFSSRCIPDREVLFREVPHHTANLHPRSYRSV